MRNSILKFDEIRKSMLTKKSGIYQISSLLNNKIYIGSSKDLYVRFAQHKSQLKKNKHGNPYLQRAFNKYGIESFRFSVVEYCSIEILIERENHHLNLYLKEQKFNNKTLAESNKGGVRSDESKKKTSDALKGKRPSNLAHIQTLRMKKVTMFNEIGDLETFESVAAGARYFKMPTNFFHQYIGEKYKGKSKRFEKGVRFRYG